MEFNFFGGWAYSSSLYRIELRLMNLLPVILSRLLLGRLWVLGKDFSVGASLVDFVGFYST